MNFRDKVEKLSAPIPAMLTQQVKMSRLIFGACATYGHNADSIFDSAGEIRTLCEGKSLQDQDGWQLVRNVL